MSRKIIFEGEYLNGKRWNGKGKKYYENRKTFEGEYIKGKLWNAKYYDIDNIYELKEGNGFVKECGEDHEFYFEGEYLNGERNGEGKEYFRGRVMFEGEYKNGLRNGKGKEYNLSGNMIFEGEYLNEKNGMEKDILN